MRPYLLVIALLCATGCDSTNPTLNAPPPTGPPTETFELVFGTDNYDEGRTLIQAANSDLLVAGAGNGVVAPADGTLPTPSLSRITPDGEVRWNRIFDEQRYGTAVAIAETTPEQFVLLTDRHNDFFDDRRLILWHLNGMQLSSLYERVGSNVSYDATRPLLVTDDGGFLLLSTERVSNGLPIVSVVRLDAAGNEQWTHALQGRIELYATVTTSDDGFVVLGSETISSNTYERRILLLRFDASGTLLWTRQLESSSRLVTTIAPAPGGFLLAGIRRDDAGPPSVSLLMIDGNGTLRSETTQDLPTDGTWASVSALASTPDGGFIATGSFNRAEQTSAAFVLKLSEAGDLVWLRSFSEANTYSRGFDVIVLADGNYAMAGTRGPNTPTFGGADFDNLVLVLDADGNLAE
ncbi:MAG TPA: hypothetical protein VKP65_11535 [Rhodothermales bacterium]|nr:hypothetical protein [Rhodothermales bacterium]